MMGAMAALRQMDLWAAEELQWWGATPAVV